MKSKIISMAKFVPELIISNDDLSKLVDTDDEWISTRSGIKNRHISKDMNTSELCARVLEQLLENAKLAADELNIIIIATTTPDYLTPTTSCIVQKLVKAVNAFCFDVGAGCSGFVYALSIADKFIRSGMYKNVAVIGADILSKVTDWTDRSTCVLFGDGAGGVILSAGDYGIIDEDIHSDGERMYAITGHHLPVRNVFNGASVEPFKEEFLKMDGRAVFDFAVREIPKSIDRLLERNNLTINEIDYIIPHQANARIIEGIAKKMKADLSKFAINMQNYGNTSAASIPITLTDMQEQGIIRLGSGKKLILCGFGSGLTWGSILITI